MKRIILRIIVLISLVIIPVLLPTSFVYAACGGGSTAKGQVLQGVGQTGGDCTGTGITTLVKTSVNILGIIIGIAGVIMVVISGFKYITSGGDSGAVASAKRTLIYALVGLVIAALAQFLVHFVINQAKNAS